MIPEMAKIFSTVFIAELGDKTQIAVLGFAASGKPLYTFIAASLALITITAIGATIGAVAGKILPQRTVQISAGIIFIIIGALYIFKALR